MSITRSPGEAPPRNGGPGMRRLVHDVLELFDLQLRLLVADAREAERRMRRPLLTLVASLAVLLGAALAAMLGVAGWLADATGWSESSSLVAVATLGAAGALVAQRFAWRGVWASGAELTRTVDELRANVSCLRTSALAHWNSDDKE